MAIAHVNHASNPLLTGLVIEPRNGNVVLNGLPGTLQFYDPIQEQHIMELEITPRNKVSRTDEKEIIPPQVLHCAFSKDKAARWMATVDGRDDHETTPELYLKFWEYDDDARTYVLNTRVDAPHTKAITSCIFNPRENNQAPMVVTTSLDGTFKIWELTHQGEARRGIEAEMAWGCRSTGFYRDMIPRCASFAADGSMLAVSYGQIITLWNPYLNTLQGVLTQPPENRPITQMTFLQNSPFLIAATKDHLYSWNLLTCSVWWSYQIKVDLLRASEMNSYFMITCPDPSPNAGAQHRIITFKPTSPQPLRIETMSKKVRAAMFLHNRVAPGSRVPKKSASDAVEPILIMNHGFDLEVLGGRTLEELRAEAEEAAEAARNEALELQKRKSLVTDIFGSSSKAEASQSKSKEKKDKSAEGVASRGMVSKKNMVRNPLFDAPSHVMAPVSSLFEAFMDQLLTQNKVAKEEAKTKRKKEQEQQEQQEQQKNQVQDVDMEDNDASKEGEEDEEASAELPSSLVNFFSSRLTLQVPS